MSGLTAACLALTWAGCSSKLLGITASIDVNPSMLAFGQGTVGVPQSIKVSITNEGSAPLLINNVKVSVDPNTELSITDALTTDCMDQPRSGSTSLAPGECARFAVVWSPVAVHEATGSVEIDSSDTQSPVITLPVTGNAAAPLLEYCILDSNHMVVPAQCSNLGVNPQFTPTVDFGTGLPNQAATRVVRIINQGQVDLTFLPSPTLVQSASVFSMSGTIPGSTLAAGASADLTLTATPTTNGTITADIAVASNDQRAPMLQIPLQIFVAGWALCVNPTAGLAFGNVALGQSQAQQITFTNCGSTDFTIDQFTFNGYSPTTTQFVISMGALPAANTTFAVGATIPMTVTYTPTAIRADKASFDYQLAVGGNALMGSVPVTGTGIAGACGTSGGSNPVAAISNSYATSSNGAYTNFNPATSPSPVVPLDYIKLNGSGSMVTGTPAYTWQLVSQPSGSTTTLSGTTGPQVTMQTLVSGNYVVSLTVKDGSGCQNTISETINVASQGDVHIELTWPESCGDVDLHYVQPGKSQCRSSDCYYQNPNTTWGAKLDHDDQWGNGPENITQASPADGTPYEIWVYYYSNQPDGGGGSGTCGNTTPTVTVFFKGVQAGAYTLTGGFSGNQLWHAADVTVSNSASVFSVAAFTSGDGAPNDLDSSCE